MKKDVKNALKRAREIEKVPVPTEKDVVSIYKDGIAQAQKLGKLLKPAWFIEDKDAPSPSRKKKTL